MASINLRNVYAARRSIIGFAQRTPLRLSDRLSALSGTEVYLKLENTQPTGSFKIRGAANRLANLSEDERRQGVVTVSTGNHGKAVAAVGTRLGIPVVVCVPRQVLAHKVDAMRALGAEIMTHGESQDEAEEFAQAYAQREGMVQISAFDDPYVIAGNGTIGLEIMEDLPGVQMVLAPLSGGGLLGGIAHVCKSVDLSIRTCGISMQRGPAMVRSVQAGRPVPVDEEETLADSLVGGIGAQNQFTFDLVRQYVDEFVLVSEDAILDAMRFALRDERLVLEGGAAVALAAVLQWQVSLPEGPVVIVLSGSNADMAVLPRLIQNIEK